MVSLTAKDCNVFRESYEKRFAHVDDISHAFGVASYYKFYWEMTGWKEFVDVLFPDWPPINVVQGCLMSVIDYLHDNRSEHCYNVGVDQGLKIVGKVNEVVNWASTQITNAIEQAKNYVKTNFIDPLEAKANQIKADLQNTQTQLSNMGINIDGFKTDVNTMKTNISSFDNSIKAFDGKLGSFDFKLKGLDSTASDLQTQFKDAQAKLNEYKTLIDNLTKRVDNLEGKQDGTLAFLRSLGLNI